MSFSHMHNRWLKLNNHPATATGATTKLPSPPPHHNHQSANQPSTLGLSPSPSESRNHYLPHHDTTYKTTNGDGSLSLEIVTFSL
ncbi:hypothetical protein HanIR_Chr17g0873171 [Helianthus annuus]|nr:hypothetical protein HanIR_Chr17g0873171 [Helianthus annuus]